MAKTANDWLNELVNGKNQVFPHMPRSDVIQGLRDRINDPSKIDQDRTSLCGAAALMYCLAKDKPADYARYVVELYHTGKGKIGKLKVEPGSDCRKYKPGKTKKIDPVDWIALASLRDSENAILDYDSPDTDLGGITMPGDLFDWFKAAGFTGVTEETNLVFTKGKGTLEKANKLYLQHKNVCLFVNAKVFEGPKAKLMSAFPNHWVVMSSKVTITKKEVDLTVYTWGSDKFRLIMGAKKMTISAFCNHFYGYISAKG